MELLSQYSDNYTKFAHEIKYGVMIEQIQQIINKEAEAIKNIPVDESFEKAVEIIINEVKKRIEVRTTFTMDLVILKRLLFHQGMVGNFPIAKISTLS